MHAVDIDGAREHYHRRAAELYYVLEGEGFVLLDGQAHPVRKGSMVHIPPGVIHGARGRMRVLVVGVPDISDDDLFFPEEEIVEKAGRRHSNAFGESAQFDHKWAPDRPAAAPRGPFFRRVLVGGGGIGVV